MLPPIYAISQNQTSTQVLESQAVDESLISKVSPYVVIDVKKQQYILSKNAKRQLSVQDYTKATQIIAETNKILAEIKTTQN